MSLRYQSSSAQAFEMPETFSFGLEERPETIHAIKLEIDESCGCSHNWNIRDESKQTLRHEGKTILECHQCKRSVAVYDWKLEQARNG